MKRAEEVYHKSLALIGETPGAENESLKERAVALINPAKSRATILFFIIFSLCPFCW